MIKKIKTVLVKAGPTIEIDYDKHDSDARLDIRNDKSRFTFSCYTREFDNCCGMLELGSFEMTNLGTLITSEQKIAGIKELFEKIVKEHKDYRGELTITFTVIKGGVYDLIKEAVKTEKLFTKVKSFKNSNSRNMVDVYISN